MSERHVRIRVTAGAKKEHLTEKKGVLFISVKEPAQDNRANRRAMRLAAGYFHVPVSAVKIVAGHRKPSKMLSIKE